ncbi:HAMP domain-containing protein [bacterium]|nr:HAMP domain-containing protein [candidate division CSSED10-310 bacterium]
MTMPPSFRPLSPADEREIIRKRKRTILIIFTLIIIIIIATLAEVLLLEKESFLVLGLLNLNLILLLLLLVLIFRNIIKVYFEQRTKPLGSKFRSKLVAVFVAMALFPTILLFLVASNLISDSIDNWFNPRLDTFLNNAMTVAHRFTDLVRDNADTYAAIIFREEVPEGLLDPARSDATATRLGKYLERFDLALIELYGPRGERLAAVHDSEAGAAELPPPESSDLQQAARGERVFIIDNEGYIRCGVPFFTDQDDRRHAATLFLGFRYSGDLIEKLRSMSAEYQRYQRQQGAIFETKVLYTTILVVITMTIIFSATWLGFYIAKGITIPIERLAEATREVASGNLDFSLDVRGYDEVGILIDAFNQMTENLRHNEELIAKAHRELKQKNIQLARKTTDMEAILQNISTGVLAIGADGTLYAANRAALNMLNLSEIQVVGKHFIAAFSDDVYANLLMIINRAFRTRSRTVQRYIAIAIEGRSRQLAVSCTPLHDISSDYQGIIAVLEDMTELLRSQRIAAWQEVARRIAHEIKNPLTPIRLSAERLQKRFQDLPEDHARLLTQLTQTIVQETEGLKKLVNEFSQFARMPASEPEPGNIHDAIDDAVSLYSGASDRVSFDLQLEEQVPEISFDREQMKRVFINLIDNAIDAMSEPGVVTITSQYDAILRILTIEVADQGRGISSEDRDRLFIPYFSTKSGGTGLGLAIVNRIVTDHRGFIRVKNNEPRGTRFIIELPVDRPTGWSF